jgi:hypothetical protein
VASPLDAAARLVGKRGRVLLHSARDDDGLGTLSFVTALPTATLIGRGRSLVRLDAQGRATRRWTADPFDASEEFLAEHGCTASGAFAGGAPPVPRVVGAIRTCNFLHTRPHFTSAAWMSSSGGW